MCGRVENYLQFKLRLTIPVTMSKWSWLQAAIDQSGVHDLMVEVQYSGNKWE